MVRVANKLNNPKNSNYHNVDYVTTNMNGDEISIL